MLMTIGDFPLISLNSADLILGVVISSLTLDPLMDIHVDKQPF